MCYHLPSDPNSEGPRPRLRRRLRWEVCVGGVLWLEAKAILGEPGLPAHSRVRPLWNWAWGEVFQIAHGRHLPAVTHCDRVMLGKDSWDWLKFRTALQFNCLCQKCDQAVCSEPARWVLPAAQDRQEPVGGLSTFWKLVAPHVLYGLLAS